MPTWIVFLQCLFSPYGIGILQRAYQFHLIALNASATFSKLQRRHGFSVRTRAVRNSSAGHSLLRQSKRGRVRTTEPVESDQRAFQETMEKRIRRAILKEKRTMGRAAKPTRPRMPRIGLINPVTGICHAPRLQVPIGN